MAKKKTTKKKAAKKKVMKPVSKVCTECGKLVVNVGGGISPSRFLRIKKCKSCAREPVKGERSGRSKLKEKEVREIYRRVNDGESAQKMVAKEFGISRTTANAICRGTIWKHLGLKPLGPLLSGHFKLTEKEVREIYQRVKGGESSQKKAAEQFNVTQETVNDICRGVTWKHLGLKPLDVRAKLKENDVHEIYQRVKSGESQGKTAKEFGISHKTASDICRGATWKHLGLKPLNARRKNKGQPE